MKIVFNVIGILLIIAFVYGWINNIIIVCHSNFTPLTGMVVVRCIGIFVAPIGAILGFI